VLRGNGSATPGDLVGEAWVMVEKIKRVKRNMDEFFFGRRSSRKKKTEHVKKFQKIKLSACSQLV
jgi:hypothetical protein